MYVSLCIQWHENCPKITFFHSDERVNDGDYFLDCAKILAPCLSSVHLEINSWTIEDFKKCYGDYVGWTGNNTVIKILKFIRNKHAWRLDL